MRWLLIALLVVHGLIHFIGPAKAFGLAELSQLSQPVARAMGVAWLAAGVSMLAAAAALTAGWRSWWILGFVAVVLSQAVIFTAWEDARVGTVANLIVLAAVLYGLASDGPVSFRKAYERAVSARLAAPVSREPVTEADLRRLPSAVQHYLRVTGAVGHPRVHHVRATWRGRIRGSQDEPWMEFTAEQHDFVDEPARFFLMRARRGGLPVHVYHAFHAPDVATMKARLLALFPMVSAQGPQMRKAETVTIFNDLSLLAPGLASRGEGRWQTRAADWAYIELELMDHEINGRGMA